MKPFWEAADFIRGLRRQMRFGELSRAPLRMLRMEMTEDRAECDWVARPADIWDSDLPSREGDRNASEQALRDAIRIRELVFAALPKVETAILRSLRPAGGREPPEVIITGITTREAPPVLRVPSLVMRAKLCGFHFAMEDGILRALTGEDDTIFEAMQNVICTRFPLRGKGGVLIYGSE
jgi:hypothetical protein